jgi:uncharacterized alkaline shock family protein YloU
MISLQTQYGNIKVVPDVIAKIAGIAALECYGIVGMASRKQVKDGIAELLGLNNVEKGIVVKENEENSDQYNVEIHVIVAYGTKISEVAAGIQQKVKYALHESIGVDVSKIDVYIQGVKQMESDK